MMKSLKCVRALNRTPFNLLQEAREFLEGQSSDEESSTEMEPSDRINDEKNYRQVIIQVFDATSSNMI
jgi:hypothetical protein